MWRAIAVGSVSAAARVLSPSGMGSSCVAGTATRRLKAPRKERKSGTGRRRQTDGRPRRQARHDPQPGVGPATTRAPVSQPVTSAPTADEGAGPLVAEDRAWAGEVVQDQVQVRAADAAMRHLDQGVARPDRGNGDVLDGQRPVADVHRRRHGLPRPSFPPSWIVRGS